MTHFGGADMRVALASGNTKEAIRDKLSGNMDWLQDDNRPIGGVDSNNNPNKGTEEGIWTYLVGVEKSSSHGEQVPVDVIPGAGGPKFGNVEYHHELKRLWDQTKDAAELHQYRDDVLDFLANGPDDKVHPDNRPPKADGTGGKSTGMWQQITDHKRTGHLDADTPAVREGNWHENQVKITPWFGGQDPEGTDPASIESERTQFTEADWLAAKAGGHTDFDIYRHLRANPTQYKGEASKQTYDFVRQGLINRSPMYVFEDNSSARQDLSLIHI